MAVQFLRSPAALWPPTWKCTSWSPVLILKLRQIWNVRGISETPIGYYWVWTHRGWVGRRTPVSGPPHCFWVRGWVPELGPDYHQQQQYPIFHILDEALLTVIDISEEHCSIFPSTGEHHQDADVVLDNLIGYSSLLIAILFCFLSEEDGQLTKAELGAIYAPTG